MGEPSVALVFSPDAWVEEMHRHCADHGGARVRHVVVEPRVALDEPYDTLVVSHRWPSLTPAFVEALHQRGRSILGVFDLVEPASHQHLVNLGVDGAVASDASMAAFVDAIVDLGSANVESTTDVPAGRTTTEVSGTLHVVGGSGGTGATEVAIGLADASSRAGVPTVLVDLDESTPAVAQRLALPGEPNVRTTIDAAVYQGQTVSFHDSGSTSFDVLAGLPNPAAWSQVRPDEVLLLLEQLTRSHRAVVVNVGSRLELVGEPGRDRYGISREVLGVADVVVGVVAPTPVGVVRAVTWCAELHNLARGVPLYLVVNRSPKDGFRRNEVVGELERSIGAASVSHVPEDRRVAQATWEGNLVARGGFTRSVDRIARDISRKTRSMSGNIA